MVRTNDDSWDLTIGVGTTATMVTTARAVASRGPDRLIDDPLAEVLVRAVGLKLFTQIVDGVTKFADIGAGWVPRYFGIRGRAFDEFAVEACRLGIRQAVILASGLDCRAYRLDWPPSMRIYEVDQPAVVEWKQNILADHGCSSTALHRCIGIDLRGDWPRALRDAGFDETEPTVWIVEGLFVGYLSARAQDAILDQITELSSHGSRIVADHVDIRRPDAVGGVLNRFHDAWSKHDPDLDLRDLTFDDLRHDPAVYLAERGWMTRNKNIADLSRTVGLPAPAADDFSDEAQYMLYLTGIRG
jgi:methyltransferase (TIGR00027 family)